MTSTRQSQHDRQIRSAGLADAAVNTRSGYDALIPEGLLDTSDLATICRTSESTVRYWRAQGKGPRWFKVGRRVVYDSADVREFLDRLRDEAAPSAS